MTRFIAGSNITLVKIIEDDSHNQQSIAEVVTDANLEPSLENGPLPDLSEYVQSSVSKADAFIFDHHLKQSQYAPFDGAEAVARFYKRRPSLLCTEWSDADIDTMRRYRRYIPVLILTGGLDPDKLAKGFEICINEFDDKFLPSREPVKTVVRIEDVDIEQKPTIVYAVIPSWDPRQVVRFPITVVDDGLRQYVRPGERFFVYVNLGAEDQAELYFDTFDYRGS